MNNFGLEPRGSEHTITIQITMMHCEECEADGAITTRDDAEAFAADHTHACGHILSRATITEPGEFAGQQIELRWVTNRG